MSIGNRVKRARKAKGISQEALARAADLSLPGISRLEQGVITDPHYSTLLKIANVLEVDVHWLYAGEETSTHPKASAPTRSEQEQEVNREPVALKGSMAGSGQFAGDLSVEVNRHFHALLALPLPDGAREKVEEAQRDVSEVLVASH